MGDHFLSVHDFNLSPEEAVIWAGVGRTPDTYPTNYGMHPQDAALCHIVRLFLDRGDHMAARRHAYMIWDHRFQALIQIVIYQRGNQANLKTMA